jgi:hypothetical protein
MIYFTTAGGSGAVIIMEPAELAQMKQGLPIVTPDGNVMLCTTPDMQWLEGEFKAMLAMTRGEVDPKALNYMLVTGSTRPEVLRKVKKKVVM